MSEPISVRKCDRCNVESYVVDSRPQPDGTIYRRRECPFCKSRWTTYEIRREKPNIDIPIYDKEETHENCTVQVLTNTITGDVSIGWWQNETSDDQTRDYWELTEDVDKYFS